MPLLIIQHIHTHWTKKSRGSEQARLRAQVADRWALPSIDPISASPTQGLRIIQQTITAREWNDFTPTIEVTTSDHDKGERIHLTLCEVMLAITGQALSAVYHYDRILGAPERPTHGRSAFELGHQQWGVITANGRSGWEDTWSYNRHVIHLGFYQHGLLPGDLRMPPEDAHFTFRDEHALK